MLPLLVCWVLRLPFVWRGLLPVAVSPVVVSGVLMLLWMACALLWSDNAARAVRELGYWRWVWLPAALWPVMHLRMWLVAGLCVGFALAHAAQVLDAITIAMGEPFFRHPPLPEPLSRVSGWWYQPATGGTMLACAVGLHVLPAMFARGRVRWVARAALAVSVLGVLATGTRGAMLGSLVVLVLAGLLRVWVCCSQSERGGSRAAAGSERWHERAGWKKGIFASGRAGATVGATVVVGVVAASGVGAVVALSPLGAQVLSRVVGGASELRAAWAGNVQSDMGGRVVALRAAVDAFASEPVRGIGLDEYHRFVRAFVAREGLAIDDWRVQMLSTAHNTPAHIAASMGVVGLALWCVLCAAIAMGLYRNAWRHALPRAGRLVGLRDALGSYQAAPLGAFVTIMVMSGFDTLHLNSAPACLLAMLAAFAVRGVVERKPCVRRG
jgi:O-antigen ligase